MYNAQNTSQPEKQKNIFLSSDKAPNCLTMKQMETIAVYLEDSKRIEEVKKAITDYNVISITLSYQPRTIKFIKNLAEVLRNNETVTSMSLSGCAIDDEGACCLASMLASNKSITYISLGGNDIADKGAEHLLEALKSRKLNYGILLEAFHLKGNKISFQKEKQFEDTINNGYLMPRQEKSVSR